MIKRIKKDAPYLILMIPGVIFYIVFRYIPILGNIMAFKDYDLYLGFIESDWVGLKYFKVFFNNPDFLKLLRNTFLLGIYSLLWSIPFSVLFALFLNEIPNALFRKTVQTISYLPYFLSLVVVCGMVLNILSPTNGLINVVLEKFGIESKHFIIYPQYFRTIFISSGIWQSMGYSAIIYLAALAGISSELYDAASIDGCSRLRKIFHIALPGILPTIVVMFIIHTGQVMRIGFQKVLLLYTPSTYEVSDIISTFVYRKGLIDGNYSYATAAEFFNSIIALVFVISANYLSKKVTQRGL